MKLLPSLLPILTILLLVVFFLNLPLGKGCVLPGETPPPGEKNRRGNPRPGEDRSRRLGRGDALPLGILCLVYALTAFFRLGDMTAPQTFVPMEGQDVLIELPGDVHISSMMLYPGVGMGSYAITESETGLEFNPLLTFEQDHVAVLKWTSLSPFTKIPPRYLRITCVSGQPWLGEVVLLDGDGQPIPITCTEPALCDEQELCPVFPYYMNSSYFDEIYHARTAWEHLHGIWPYEITHPPLGKIIMGLGITLFGMTPFGWRFSGTLFGLLMLPLLYVFLKKLFGGRCIPTMGTVLFASDFMHYVQTRIATIDTYSVFFILLMYLFMYLWLTEDKPWALALCGVSFGLGAAAKWTSIYAGLGLALLWLGKWVLRFAQERKAARAAALSPDAAPAAAPAACHCEASAHTGRGNPHPPSPQNSNLKTQNSPSPDACHCEASAHTGRGNPSLSSPQNSNLKTQNSSRRSPSPVLSAFLRNVCFCLVFFILVPGLIYYFSYLPYGAAKGFSPFSKDYAVMVVNNQYYMFHYHSNSVLGATHPYSSVWYQWLVDYRPILYVLEYPREGTRMSIAAWLNPVLCWGGLMSLPVLGWMAVTRRDKRAIFLLVGYLSQLLPWVLIPRLTFAYHYFPSALFLVLCLSYVLALLRENRPDWRTPALALTGGSVLLFILFFPVLNGLEVRRDVAEALLRWFSSWPV